MESVEPAGAGEDSGGASLKRSEGGGLIRWTIEPGWEGFVTGPSAPRWLDLGSDSSAALIKSNAVRRVWRVTRSDRAVFVKEHLGRSWRAMLRRSLRGSEALIEYRAARLAGKKGVPCVAAVACGRWRGRSFLITQAVPNAGVLADAWCVASMAERASMVRAVARLLARAHASGFVHGDDHPRNILIERRDDSGLRAVYVDVACARISDRVSDSAAATSLAQLNQWFRSRVPRICRLRFLWRYCFDRVGGDRVAARRLMRGLSAVVFARTHAQSARLWSKRDRRILGSNAYFARVTTARGAGAHVTLRFRQRDLFPQPSFPDQTVEAWRRILATTGGGEGPASVTMCHYSGGASVLGRLLRRVSGSSARRAFVMGHRLRHRDLPCRWPIALIGATDGDAIWVDPHPRARRLTDALSDDSLDVRSRRRVTGSLAGVVARMSDRGASVAIATVDTFGVTDSHDVIIEDPTGVRLRHRDPRRGAEVTTRALYALLLEGGGVGRTDAVHYLRSQWPRDWKAVWRHLVGSIGAG